MSFIKHENFPDALANLVRHYEHWQSGTTTLKFPQELYGESVAPGEWLPVIGNQAWEHRPVVLTMDDGIKENTIGLKTMKGCGCSFVILAKAWAERPLTDTAWRILRYWPEIVAKCEVSRLAKRQCRIEVTIKGKLNLTNL